jgi:hypothetical protein
VAELVDAPDLGSGIARCGGSSPLARTKFLFEAMEQVPSTFFWIKTHLSAFLGEIEVG